jgi:sulfatase maturation enzyme AslB (radical SAM superfamily)
MTGEIIKPETLIKLFNDAPKLGVKSLTLTGDGEPTLNPGLYSAVITGKNSGLDIGVATNGIALSPAKTEVLLRNCTWIRFNLSAVDRKAYKLMHGVDLWNIVMANIIQAVNIKKEIDSLCTIGLQMVLTPHCFDQVIPEAKFAVDNELDYFVIKQFSDPGCKEMSQFPLDWYDNVDNVLFEAEHMSTEKTKIIAKHGMIHSKGRRPYDHCVDCPLIFQISGNSKCYPCGYLFNNDLYCYGDLSKQSLKEIVTSERYWSIIHELRYNFNVHKDCSGCCRHDFTNEFIWQYLNPPEHLNFI